MNQNWFKCAWHSRYLLTVAIKSFGTDYLVMVLALGIDNTGVRRAWPHSDEAATVKEVNKEDRPISYADRIWNLCI